MRLRCKLLTAYEDAVGRDELTLDVGDGTTVDRLLAEILSRHAEITLTPGLPVLLVNGDRAAPDDRLAPADEIALLPVMLGG